MGPACKPGRDPAQVTTGSRHRCQTTARRRRRSTGCALITTEAVCFGYRSISPGRSTIGRPVMFHRDVTVSGRPRTLRTDDPDGALLAFASQSPGAEHGGATVGVSTMTGMTQPAPAAQAEFPVTTALGLQGMTIERDVGVAFGLIVRSMGAVKSIGAGFKAMRQGEVTQYTELLEDSRRHAMDRMIENARLLGANAVVAMRFDSSEIGQQFTEIVAYGTAVVARPAG